MQIFRKWLPNWAIKVLLFALIVPNMVLFFLPVANEAVTAGYYGIEVNDVQFMIGLYYVGFASFYCLERRFYNYFSSKYYFIIFQLIQLICCYLLFQVEVLWLLWAIRFIQGMLFASAVNLYLSLASSYMKSFRAKEVSYSLFFGMLLCTGSFNNLITADLIDHFNFDMIYKAAMLLYALCVLLVLICMRPTTILPTHKLIQLDVASFIFLATGLVSLSYMSIYGQQYYWLENNSIVVALCISIVSLSLFLVRQLLLKRPYIHLSIFTHRHYWWGILLLFLMYIERFSFTYVGSFYKEVLRMDPKHISYMYIFNLVGIAVGVIIAAYRQIKKRNVLWLWVGGFSCLLIYHLSMSQLLFYAANEWYYCLPLMAHGVGIGLIMVPTILYCISVVPYFLAPSAAAFCLVVRFLGYTVSTALTKYFTVRNYNLHYTRFIEYINGNNAFYHDKINGIQQMLTTNGLEQSKVPKVAQAVFKSRLDHQILIRSILDYYTLMIYLSLIILVLLIAYWIKVKQYHVKFRPLLPI